MEPKKTALSSKSGSEKKSGPWQPTKWQVLWAIGMVVALLTTALLIVNLRPDIWKGLLEERNLTLVAIGVSLTAIIVLLAVGAATSRWTGFRGKTVWDWMGLLIVPMVLVGIGILFEMQQADRQRATEDHQNALSEQRAQDEALEAYLDQMSGLLLEKDLRASEKGDEVRTLARARTLTVLGRLDPNEGRMPPSGKTALMQFLVETELVQGVDGRGPIISLRSADLRKAYLFDANLRGAILRNAHLTDADLSGADLTNAEVTTEQLREAKSLAGATMPNGQKYEE